MDTRGLLLCGESSTPMRYRQDSILKSNIRGLYAQALCTGELSLGVVDMVFCLGVVWVAAFKPIAWNRLLYG